ncbi:MAG: patatin-like phospholipase family protein [Deltaproteobacteria bacterium]|nr:patatin-like phospholipase family protein [Deltaproteobacteria bacterium]
MISLFKKRRKKIGLALGGGAARGGAHIGVINALKAANIPIDYVAGTSIGALVGGFLAIDKMDALEQLVLGLDWKTIIKFFDVVFPKVGLVEGKKVEEILRKSLGEVDIKELPIPFAAVATDIVSGEEVILNAGDIVEAIRASIAIPGIFTPIKWQDRILVDGGLVNPVPVNVVKKMGAEIVIGVDVNAKVVIPTMQKMKKLTSKDKETKEAFPNIIEIIMSAIYIMEQQITKYKLASDKADILIEPEVGHIGFLEFHRTPETIAEGYKTATEKMKEIKALANV